MADRAGHLALVDLGEEVGSPPIGQLLADVERLPAEAAELQGDRIALSAVDARVSVEVREQPLRALEPDGLAPGDGLGGVALAVGGVVLPLVRGAAGRQ